MRKSAFRGNWVPNKRPYVTLTPDVFVSIQGETSVIGCGECRTEININDYVTSVSTEASVDSSPGSATINLSVPDTDVNNFYVDGQLVIISMMEIEIYSKGYFLIGGFPQYYRIFWGVVSSVSKSWSGGTTTIAISCKDILRWWELTTVTINPAFLDSFGGSAGGYQLWQNQFAGNNPMAIIINLAREAMGDFSLTTGSFTSFIPEKGPEGKVIGSYARDVMTYWQLKFANIWNSLVIYGSSGQLYQFTPADGDTISPNALAAQIHNEEEKLAGSNQATTVFKIQPGEITPFKQELSRAGDVEFFQSEQMSKLSIAQVCRDQQGWEFFCDPSGDIVFKPPFYNLNVLPNKPVSWIQNYEIIDDSITESEAEVFTHITSSGNAFGGTMDYGLNDEITTPRTGVIDYHLLRRFGWRRLDYQCEWAGNPKKLFYWLMDYLDRMNAKRQSGTVTIPLRPELKLGFPIWFPKYDSFFYVAGISHQFSVGGQATSTLTLMAKRSKFIAPNNIGFIKTSGNTRTETIRDYSVPWKPGQPKTPPAWVPMQIPTYEIGFPDRVGETAGLNNEVLAGKPVIIRDPRTGKLLGYPNAVMVYRSTTSGTVLARILESQGSKKAKNPSKQDKKNKDPAGKSEFTYRYTVGNTFNNLRGDARAKTIMQLRAHRYEAGMSSGGAYDYANDESRSFKDITLIPTASVSWNKAGEGPNSTANDPSVQKVVGVKDEKTKAENQKVEVEAQQKKVNEAKKKVDAQVKKLSERTKELNELLKKLPTVPKTKTKAPPTPVAPDPSGANLGLTKNPLAGVETLAAVVITEPDEIVKKRAEVKTESDTLNMLQADLATEEENLFNAKNNSGNIRSFADLNVLVRPVSDEFGFEVIGHNKYGRGAFIDRGKMQLAGKSPGEVINQINVQFAPTSGLLTDPGVVGPDDGSSLNFASSFERMQPDDYVTGASFAGANKSSDVKDFQYTSQETYTNLINSNLGKSLYIEADATRKSQTLGELKPTLSIGGLSDGAVADCDCGLGRSDWIALLPISVIQKILAPTEGGIPPISASTSGAPAGFTTARTEGLDVLFPGQVPADTVDDFQSPSGLTREELNAEFGDINNQQVPTKFSQSGITTPGATTNIITGNLTSHSFFAALTEYLQKTTLENYTSGNAEREKRSNASTKGVVSQLFDAGEQTNILGDPQNPLFDRAASGDPDAIKALQDSIANSNFDMTEAASKNFKKAWDSGVEKLDQTFKHFGSQGNTTVFAVSTNEENVVTVNVNPGVGASVVAGPQQAEADKSASTSSALSSLTQATTGVPPSQVPQPKQVQVRIPSPNLKSLIVNPSSPTSKNQKLIDQKENAFRAGIGILPGMTETPPTIKPIKKKPGTP